MVTQNVNVRVLFFIVTSRSGNIRASADHCDHHWSTGPQPASNTRRGVEFCERGPHFLNCVQHIFSKGAKIFRGEPPLVTRLLKHYLHCSFSNIFAPRPITAAPYNLSTPAYDFRRLNAVNMSGLVSRHDWKAFQFLLVAFEKFPPRVAFRGGARHFHLGGASGGASFATRGAVNGLCRTFRKRPENFWGARQNFGGAVAPLEPPSSAPGCVENHWFHGILL